MNSDPDDRPAWRGFGMLDADETAAYEDILRQTPSVRDEVRETDRVMALIALATSRPIPVGLDHLGTVRSRIGLRNARRVSSWLAPSGWAAAAALALLLAWEKRASSSELPDAGARVDVTKSADSSGLSGDRIDGGSGSGENGGESGLEGQYSVADSALRQEGVSARREIERKEIELALLKRKLADRDGAGHAWKLGQPGIAMPVIMNMAPPDLAMPDPAMASNESPVSRLLEDALGMAAPAGEDGDATASNAPGDAGSLRIPQPGDVPGSGMEVGPEEVALPLATPSAIPIYDAARDQGTLVVTQLSSAPEGNEYNFWVQTPGDAGPILVGILPEAGKTAAESFDFSLGQSGRIPSGFILTQDPQGRPAKPTISNIVLQSPQVAGP